MSPTVRHLAGAVVALVLAATSTAPPTAARGQAGQVLPGQPSFRTGANYVRVDVYATANGTPVLDLERDDFSITEDGVAQSVDQFERVLIRNDRGPTPGGGKPTTVAESRALVAASRARVMVLFLDVNHVELDANHTIRKPLLNALNQLIGPDDLVAVMTPEMSAADITFDRSAQSIESLLSRHWDWGERNKDGALTDRERMYQACYPGTGPTQLCPDDDRGIADEMIDRLREQQTIESLDNLVRYLRDVREERKAVLVISDGWRLYTRNPSLARRVNCRVPVPTVGLDPQSGRPTTQRREAMSGLDSTTCDGDRIRASEIDDAGTLRDLVLRANRGNVSFYTIDPRGMAVFDTSLAPPRTGRQALTDPPPTDIVAEAARLRARDSSLRDLAVGTDGIAVNTNDLEAGLNRIATDLSSYYLVSYYSTGKLDGRFHAINVRVKRPGVQIRARRGYLAASEADIRATTARPAPSGPAPGSPAAAMAATVAGIGASARDVRLRIAAPSAWPDGRSPRWYVTGEVNADPMWRTGFQIMATISSPAGDTIATGRATLAAGARAFRLTLTGTPAAAPGEYTVQVRAQPTLSDAPSELASATAPLQQAPVAVGAILSRTSPATGNREVPAVDVRFRRSERLRADVPDITGTTVSARLIDRNGNPLQVPVSVTPATNDDGSRWQSAQLALAPLGQGDYALEIVRRTSDGTGNPEVTLVGFRVVL